jgi:adenylosuccinate synthase
MFTDSTADKANESDPTSDGELTWTPEEETKVRRKLDRVIVPLTTLLYLLCFLDRYELFQFTQHYQLTTCTE